MVKTIKFGLNNLTKRLQLIKAQDIMTRNIITATEDMSLSNIAELMIKRKISGLPVVRKKDKIVGIITATDLLIVMDIIKSGEFIENSSMGVSKPSVKFAMSREVIKIKTNTTLDKIITLIKYKNAYTLPVFEGNKMVGVIGRRDVLKHFYAVVKELNL